MLVAGEDRYGHWDPDPEPTHDLDPLSIAALDKVWADYRDRNATKQTARTAAT
jgi:hypothetical protein